jgi:hypothetical protein
MRGLSEIRCKFLNTTLYHSKFKSYSSNLSRTRISKSGSLTVNSEYRVIHNNLFLVDQQVVDVSRMRLLDVDIEVNWSRVESVDKM